MEKNDSVLKLLCSTQKRVHKKTVQRRRSCGIPKACLYYYLMIQMEKILKQRKARGTTTWLICYRNNEQSHHGWDCSSNRRYSFLVPLRGVVHKKTLLRPKLFKDYLSGKGKACVILKHYEFFKRGNKIFSPGKCVQLMPTWTWWQPTEMLVLYISRESQYSSLE